MTPTVLAVLVRTALGSPETARSLKTMALDQGATEQEWEDMAMKLTMRPPDPAEISARIGESEPAEAALSSSSSYGEWLPTEPKDADPQWNAGDFILFRDVSPIQREFMVLRSGVVTTQAGTLLRVIAKGA